jgi:hypothetical protein
MALSRFLTASRRVENFTHWQFDDFSSYWLAMLKVLREHGGHGQDETIAIIDSGFTEHWCGDCHIDKKRSLDLTGQGLADVVGHGTALSILVNAIAPRATQYHVKLFDVDGRITGSGYEDEVAQIQRAFDHVEQAHATIVNVSWAALTEFGGNARALRRHFCHCRACAIIGEYVKRTDVDVFAAQGNFLRSAREARQWSCPAAAEFVVPVLGFVCGESPYDMNIDYYCGVPGPAKIRVASGSDEMTVSISGSSFATPIVAATFAVIKSAFRLQGYRGKFVIPRGTEDEHEGRGYNWPLEIFFAPPDANEYWRDKHEDWCAIYRNCWRDADLLEQRGDDETAGKLCALLADVMLVPFRRMEHWLLQREMGECVIELYLRAITLLLRSRLAMTADRYFRGAHEALALRAARGNTAPGAEAKLMRLEAWHSAHVTEFM